MPGSNLPPPAERGRVTPILAFRPDAIFFLSGAISWKDDFPFLHDVKGWTRGSR